MKKIRVSKKVLREAQNIIDGVYYPVTGFVDKDNLKSILNDMRLIGGEIWPMPVVWDVDKEDAHSIKGESKVGLADELGRVIYVVHSPVVFSYDKEYYAKSLFGTLDKRHPGVAAVFAMEDFLVGGDVVKFGETVESCESYLCPKKTKELFKKMNWKTVAAFQTRNAPHRSHEHLQLEALKIADGVFINPIIGDKKQGDLHDDHILGAYQILINDHHPKDKFALGTFHTFMRYAGPKEAVFHALVRRNFGCTHMIIGRDHAGVGNYYGAYEAQEIFNSFAGDELGISIIKFENAAYCSSCNGVVFDNDCNHKDKIFLSGTELRERLRSDSEIPQEFMRQEIIDYLRNNKETLFI